MIYLLDVNALIALGLAEHSLHARVTKWLQAESYPPLATCSITELGFVRVLAQSPLYSSSVIKAQTLLLRLKQSSDARLTFLPDGQDISKLPTWVKTPNQTTDGHLAALARAHAAALATLDERIPDAYLIP